MDPKSMAGDWIKDVAKQKRDNLRELACGASHLLPISIEHTIKATTSHSSEIMLDEITSIERFSKFAIFFSEYTWFLVCFSFHTTLFSLSNECLSLYQHR